MLSLLLFLSVASAKVHHFYIGETVSRAIHAVEMDDELRTLFEMGIIPGTTASPSLAIDHARKFLFASNPQDGMLTRYAIQTDYALVPEANTTIPASCNTTTFTTLHLTPHPSTQNGSSLYGSASTGTCSILFTTTLSTLRTLRSREYPSDIRSLAWSPNGRHLHALDSRASVTASTSIFTFDISAEDPGLSAQNETDVLANVTGAEMMVGNPRVGAEGGMVYVVTRGTNELVALPLGMHGSSSPPPSPSRFKILPPSLDTTAYSTLALTISSSNTHLWTLSQSPTQAVVTVFSLDPSTGAVIKAVARAGWTTGGGAVVQASISPAPWLGGDIVAVGNSPVGYVAFVGLDEGAGKESDARVSGEDFLEDMMMGMEEVGVAPKLKSYGRIGLGFGGLGEGVWVD